MHDKIYFLSSDARPLYLKDVYKALTLPVGYVLQFRYQRKYTDKTLRSKDVIGKEGAIFFSHGNNLNIPEDQRSITNLSIRKIEIIELYESQETGLLHYYLKLKDFVDWSLELENTYNNNLLVGNLRISNALQKTSTWLERVNLTKDKFWHYPTDDDPKNLNVIFLYIKEITRGNKLLNCEYNSNSKKSFFQLEDQAEYNIKISYLSSSSEVKSIKICSSSLLHLENDELVPDARLDDAIFTFSTDSIKSHTRQDYVKFISVNDDFKMEVPLIFHTSKKLNKTFCFFISILMLGLWGGQVFTSKIFDKPIGKIDFCWAIELGVIAIVCSVFVGMFSGLLYKYFDKK